jgi:hypothetical protein
MSKNPLSLADVVIKLQVQEFPNDQFVVQAYCEVPEGLLQHIEDIPTVSLARVPDHCFFPVTNFQAHNSHMPLLHSTEEKDAFIERIQADTYDAIKKFVGKQTKKAQSTIIPNAFEVAFEEGVNEDEEDNDEE